MVFYYKKRYTIINDFPTPLEMLSSKISNIPKYKEKEWSMKKTVLVTDSSPENVLGHGLSNILREKYTILTPSEKELDCLNFDVLKDYIDNNGVDCILHTASARKNYYSSKSQFYETMKMFVNLEKASNYVDKILYFGSGAEYNKKRNIENISEEAFGQVVPESEHAILKYIMSQLSMKSDNIYNLRVFGVAGEFCPWDMNFISNLCCKAIFDLPLTIRKNCLFDYIYIKDLACIVEWFFENKPKYNDYNICSGKGHSLIDIAEIVNTISGSTQPIQLLDSNYGLNYTGSNARLLKEYSTLQLTDMNEIIGNVIAYFEKNKHLVDYSVLVESK